MMKLEIFFLFSQKCRFWKWISLETTYYELQKFLSFKTTKLYSLKNRNETKLLVTDYTPTTTLMNQTRKSTSILSISQFTLSLESFLASHYFVTFIIELIWKVCSRWWGHSFNPLLLYLWVSRFENSSIVLERPTVWLMT